MEEDLIRGDLPAKDTLGVLLLTIGNLAADEWRESRSTDEENPEREMRQFVWCLPA